MSAQTIVIALRPFGPPLVKGYDSLDDAGLAAVAIFDVFDFSLPVSILRSNGEWGAVHTPPAFPLRMRPAAGVAEVRNGSDSVTPHSRDAHCTVDRQTLRCGGCGADHSTRCPLCGGRGFHVAGCAEVAR